ncbi:MAG: hypothetical protein N2049_07905 [Anaerolineales bacterium]|nr:hypothetical protein [Anaerolineales bacterium]
MLAVGAESDIRRDRLERALDGGRFPDFEGREPVGALEDGHFERVDVRQGRFLLADGLHKSAERLFLALDFDLHAGGGVVDPAAQAEAGRQPVDERAKPNSLYNAGDVEMPGEHR